jgi:hypothetical protein
MTRWTIKRFGAPRQSGLLNGTQNKTVLQA